jgi:HAE1 family hydrophobic/amphiphilic exporter-1
VNISRRFIEYPVMTALVVVALIVAGLFGYAALPVNELPNVDFPTLVVYGSLSGADPETMAASIATPLEKSLAEVPGVSQMTSSNTQGATNITLQFDLDRNLAEAAQDVQAAINNASHLLPRTIINPPGYAKTNPTDAPIIKIALSSDTLPITTVDKYAEEILRRRLSALSGVARVIVWGSQQYAVRIQADPNALLARNIGLDTLTYTLNSANAIQATGALNGPTQAKVIHSDSQLHNADEYRNQIIAYNNGAAVRLGDVARVLDSSSDTRTGSWWQDHPAIQIFVYRQAGANTIQLTEAIKKELPKFQSVLPGSVKMEVMYDRSQTVRAAVFDVQSALLIAAVLVVLVIYVFLRNASATIISSISLPIAVIGTFAGMALAGFSLDTLSLMALTLSVGFVVDDAIVMLENIVRHIEDGLSPYEAAMKGSAEIGFTILSMTVSLAAVFIPIIFMSGILGRLLHEFAITIILAIVISGAVSVTLIPMLCARFLNNHLAKAPGKFHVWCDKSFAKLQHGYERTLRWSMDRKPLVMAGLALSFLISVVLFEIMPLDFLPSDDIGQLQAGLLANQGTSYEKMVEYTRYASRLIDEDPNVHGAASRVSGGLGGAGAFTSQIDIALKPLSERKLSAEEVTRELRTKLSRIPGVSVFIFNQPSIQIGGRVTRSNYQYTLSGLDLDELRDVSTKMVRAMQASPVFVGVNSDNDKPASSVEVKVNRDRAAALGVSAVQIEAALGSAFGGQQIAQIDASENQYIVILELLPKYQTSAASLRSLYVTSSSGNLVPLSAVTTISSSTVPVVVNHTGSQPSITVSFELAKGYALSDGLAEVQKISRAIVIPATVSGSFQGTANAFQTSTQNMGMLVFVGIIVVYIVLGILYESFIHPLTILSGLPSAAMGALLILYLAGMPLTVYAFVGMIMLIGIVKKNAIMMIDFALQRERKEGIEPEPAIYEAAVVRFRPIMMTTMAAMMGTMPIVFGVGMGADSRRPLGFCVAGGLLFSQFLTLYITPVVYVYLDRFAIWLRSRRTYATSAQTASE